MSEIKNSPVKGYTDQNKENIENVNQNKYLEESVLKRLDVLFADDNSDKRWLSIAETHIEEGFMAMNRAVFKPKRISE